MKSDFGLGNGKLGPHVWTYSRMPAQTCPGATDWCLDHCYAIRMLWRTNTLNQWTRNTHDQFPTIPRSVSLLRIHVGGDFDTTRYIESVE